VESIKVLVIEDDAFSRVALVDALRLQRLEVVAGVGSAKEAIDAQMKFQPTVAVCDLDLGVGPTGLDIAQVLRKNNPNIGIVMLTSYRDPRLAGHDLPPLPQGAILLNKRELQSMSTIMMQIVAASSNPLKKRKSDWSKSHKFQSLSDTQISILISIADGIPTSKIAADRGVSEQAIEKTIARICKNLDIPQLKDKNQRVQIVRAFFYGAGKEI
jgi:DNA-binding NarL/FixJ family response regulator